MHLPCDINPSLGISNAHWKAMNFFIYLNNGLFDTTNTLDTIFPTHFKWFIQALLPTIIIHWSSIRHECIRKYLECSLEGQGVISG